jgi:hypothetical protein
MSTPIKFDRKPYVISYMDAQGQQQKIRRVPPPKLHNALPTDRVELRSRRSDHFEQGDEVTVKSINPRHPNVLKVENDKGQTTFITHYDMIYEQKDPEFSNTSQIPVSAVVDEDTPINNSYLDWP